MSSPRLQLSQEQRESLRPVRETHAEGMRELHEAFESGALSAAEAGNRAIRIREEAEQKAQSIMTAEQWDKLKQFREQREKRMVERHSSRLGRHADRQATSYIRRLDLSKSQASSVRRIFEQTIPKRRGIANGVESRGIPPEKAFFAMRQIDKDAEAGVRALLTPEQTKRLDAWKELRPLGPGPGARHPFGRAPGDRRPPGRRGPRI